MLGNADGVIRSSGYCGTNQRCGIGYSADKDCFWKTMILLFVYLKYYTCNTPGYRTFTLTARDFFLIFDSKCCARMYDGRMERSIRRQTRTRSGK